MQFPEGWDVATVLDTAAALQDEADRRINGRLDAMQRRQEPVSCATGCHACCHQFVVVSPMEALALGEYVRAHPEMEPRLKNARTAWGARVAAAPELSLQLDAFEAADGYVRGANGARLETAYWRERIPCPFLDSGRCSVYRVRPFACREHYVTSPPNRCEEDLDTATPAGTRMEYRAVASEVGTRCFDLPDRLIPLPRALDYAAEHSDEAGRTAPTPSVTAQTETAQRQTRLALAVMTQGRLTQRQ